MVELLATHDSDALKKYRPQMEKEYAYWMEGLMGSSLVRRTNAW